MRLIELDMGNNCVGSRVSISNSLWWSRSPDMMITYSNGEVSIVDTELKAPKSIQTDPPGFVMIVKENATSTANVTKLAQSTNYENVVIVKEENTTSTNSNNSKPVEPKRPKMAQNVRRMLSVGLRENFVLRTKTGHLKEYYNLGKTLGRGQFGTTFLCVEKATGKEYACKSIAKRKLITKDDVDDVRREIEIMHHLSGDPNVVSIKGAYEDAVAVHLVMEICGGGELFDRINKLGHYTERKAAKLSRTIVSVVEGCHSLGVMHRDLKPENFLFVSEDEDSPLKTIDFGLSVFFKPGKFQIS